MDHQKKRSSVAEKIAKVLEEQQKKIQSILYSQDIGSTGTSTPSAIAQKLIQQTIRNPKQFTITRKNNAIVNEEMKVDTIQPGALSSEQNTVKTTESLFRDERPDTEFLEKCHNNKKRTPR